MSYGSIDGVKDNLPKLSKYIVETADNNLDISYDRIQRILDEVSGQIDAALLNRYQVPITGAVPDVITGIANDLTAFKISRSYQTTISAEENQNILALRKDAKELLAAINAGDYVLQGVPAAAILDEVQAALQSVNQTQAEEIFDMEDDATWQTKL